MKDYAFFVFIIVVLLLLYWGKRAEVSELSKKLAEIESINKYVQGKKSEIEDYHVKKQTELTNLQNTIIQEKTNLEKARRETNSYIVRQKKDLDNQKQAFTLEIAQLKKDLDNQKQDFTLERERLEKILSAKTSTFPVIATMIADYTAKRDEYIAKTIEEIRPRAFKARDEVNKLKEEKKKLLAENLEYKWEIQNLYSLLPWLDEIKDEHLVPQETDCVNPTYNGKDDDAHYWLSQDEYDNLSTVEKYQRALDRYVKRRKSNAEIGKEYERYIGYLYECKGFKVEYFGIEKGLEDLGRDLVCVRGDTVHIVQCKCWSSQKQIHEKHINQLFGTTVMYYLTTINPHGTFQDFSVHIKTGKLSPVFVATTNYSETAIKFAHSLGIELIIKELGDYPRIKCNINQSTGEKIYHLPFDQQYDKVKIDKEGEFFAKTVAEAEEKGFRRAMRWFG